jgi:hypothetical protein
VAKYLCARCHQEIYCDETHPRRVCSFCAVRGKRKGRLPEEPSPWNEYATRILEDTPSRLEEELGLGNPQEERWRRCGNSKFYILKDWGNRRLFLNPVELTLVSMSPRKEEATISKTWVLELNPNTFHLLNKDSRTLVNSWMNRVVSSFNPQEDWMDSVLADLDVDTIERENLLDSLYMWFIGSDQEFEYESYRGEPSEIEALLNEFGIPAC